MTDINREDLRQFIRQRKATPAVASEPVQDDERRGFTDGLQQGWHGLKASAGGLTALAGEKLESDALYDAGMGLYDRETAQAAEHDLGYGLSDFFSERDDLERDPGWGEYIAHSLGSMLPSVALSMGTGGAGGIAARGVAQGLTRNLSARGAAQATQAGQVGGAVASGAGEYTGSLYGELGDSDVALAHGVIAGTLDAVLPAGLLRTMSPAMRSQASNDITQRVLKDAAERGVLGNIKQRGMQGAATEGVTEGLQSIVEQHARYWVEENGESLLANAPDIDWRGVVDGMGVGAVAGAGLSAPSGAVESRNARRELDQLNQQAEQSSAPDPLEEGAEGGIDEAIPGDEDADSSYQRASDLGNRIQMAMSSVDDIAGRAKGTFEATTRLRNVRRLIDESERHFENNEIDLAEIKLGRAQEIERSLQENLSRTGTRERPIEGEVYDEPPVSGLLGQDNALGLEAPDPNVINMGGPTADTTHYEPQARHVRRDEGMAAQREGAEHLRTQVAGQHPQLVDSGIVYGDGPVAGNANTGLDQPFADPRFQASPEAASPQREAIESQQVNAPTAETAPILKADSKPFQTRRAVELSKRFRDTPNAQPVEVEGGWGFLAPTETEATTSQVPRSPGATQGQDTSISPPESQVQAPADRAEAERVFSQQGYSLNPEPRTPNAAPIRSEIEASIRDMPEMAGTRVVQSTAELPPSALMGMALRGVNPSDVRGMFVGDELYVVADNVDSVEDGIRTAVHEAVGHKGVRGVLGDELDTVMRQVYNSLPLDPRGREAFNEVLESYPFLDRSNPEHQVMIAEEMVAHLTEKGWQPNVLRRAVAKIRELLRRYFPNMNWTDADVMQLSERSRDYLRQQQRDTESQGEPHEPSAPNNGQQGDDTLFSLRNAFDDFSDADRSAAEKIGRPPTTRRLKDYLKQRWDGIGERVRVGAVDQYAALKRLDEQVHGKDMAEENITASSWVLARMSSAANGALHTMMTAGRLRYMEDQRVISTREDTRGLGEVLGELGSPAEIERFFGWVAGNRSKQLADQGRENLFEPNEIEAMTTWNRGRLADGRSRIGAYASVFREFQQYRDDVLSIAEETGVISSDARALWRDEFYVPFYRVQRDEKAPAGPMPAAGLSRQKQMKKLKGGKENLNDLLENTMLNFHYLLEASLKNRAASQALDNARQAGIAHQVPESNRDTQTSTYVLRDGKKTYYQVDDPLVFNALTALADPGMNSTMMQFMRQMKRIFTVGVTATPQFQVANLMRDSMQAVATSPVSKNAFGNVIKGGMAYRDAKMMAAGGSFHFGHVYGSSPDEIRAQMAKVRSETFTINSLKDMKQGMNRLMAPWQKWTEFNNFTENINRARIYEQNAAERGELYANFQARDLIDFGARGAWPAMRILTDIVPFLNARIQGLDKIYRSGIKPGTNVVAAAFGYGQPGVSDKQAAARFWAVAGAMSLASVALYLNNREEEEFKKLEDWQKDSYYHFFFGDTHIQIPKPFEVGAITTLAERITEQFVDDEATGDLFAQRLGHMLTQTFSFSPVPQAVQPMLDVYSNRDAFTGRPIESMGMDRMSPELRRRESTTKLASGLSHGLNATVGGIGDPDDNPFALSPVQVDHLIGGYLGQLGSWGAGAIDIAWNTATGHDTPAKRWYEYQPVRRFYRNLGNEDTYTKYGTVFYDALREAQRAHTDMRELREMGRLEEAQALARNKGDLLRLRPALNSAQTRLRTIGQQIEETQRSALSAEEKRQRIDRYRAIRNQIQKALGERVEQARRAG
ncbi:LPD38 domain-containing protein [Halomonas sp. AOP30-A1-24]|uniref:LPD38 domain-containing protein n=3 Tax=Halomonas TaxID=2745 RepID=UPI00403381AD